MKRIILALSTALLVTACKKENKVEENTTKSDSTATVSQSDQAPASVVASLKEVSPEKASELLNAKNDTLYVTNFFATWCGPCMREIPHFKEKMEELKGQPVKFAFVSLDDKADWPTAVNDFAKNHALEKNVALLDGNKLTPEWFASNFKTYKGEAIPFTFMRKGDKTDEYMGGMSKELLTEKINSFK